VNVAKKPWRKASMKIETKGGILAGSGGGRDEIEK